MPSISIRKEKNAVVLVNNEARFGIAFSWETADFLVEALLRDEEGRDYVDTFTAVLRTPEVTLIEYNGTPFLPILAADFSALDALVRAVSAQARLVEEEEKHAAVADDAAILFKAGAPFGLTSNPHIQREAINEAAWGSLRRRMPIIGIRSSEMLGAPTVTREDPK